MSHKTHFMLLFLLQATNPGQAAPATEQRDTSQTSSNIITAAENDLLEGDMVIDQTVWNIFTNTSEKRSAVKNSVRLWPGGIVPYVINSQLSSLMQSIIYQAMRDLHASSCIQFKARTNENCYVEFIKGGRCWSYVGRQLGKQWISLGDGCESVGTALHEMVHALGFFHTSSRSDRDAYVIVYDKNIKPDDVHNFHKYSHGDIDRLNSPYDITSIMHLPRNAFAKSPNLVTISARAGAHIKLGETGKLSPVDKYQLNTLYKCSFTTASSSCMTELGLQDPQIIPNSAMRASDYPSNFKPSQARLHLAPSADGMGAWCPVENNSSGYLSTWLEIDLGRVVRVNGIATQGYDGFSDAEFAPRYDLKYRKYSWESWYSYISTSGAYGRARSLPGNWDGFSVQFNALSPTIYARYVRIYPKSWYKRPCLRVEFYGC